MSRPPGGFAIGVAKDWGIAIALIAVVVLAWQWMSRSGVGIGDLAPDFTLPTLDGELVTLSELRGEVVVLNFWATWCGPCRAEMPALNAFQEANPHIRLLGVSVDETMGAAGIRATARRHGADYTVLLDPDGVAAGPYSVSTLPTTVVVGPDGTVIGSRVGTVNERQLERLTAL